MRLLSRLTGSIRRNRPADPARPAPTSAGRHHRPPPTTPGQPAPGRPAPGGLYRSAAYAPLRPWQVRRRRFRSVGPLRRGLDPHEVQDFLRQVADDLTTVYAELHRSREEAGRVKDALRRWQSQYAPRVDGQAYAPRVNERAYR